MTTIHPREDDLVTLEELWEKTDDELYEMLGAALQGEGERFRFSPEDEDESRRFGKEWFADRHRDLQRRICHQKSLQMFMTISTEGRTTAFGQAAEVIRELLEQGGIDPIAATIAAVLVARVGLGQFCKNAPAPA